MILPADVNTAIVNRWAAAGLDATVPGSIKTGRRPPYQPGTPASPLQQPYAAVETRPVGEIGLYTESGTAGGPYNARFEATVRVWGIGEKAVGDILRTVAGILDSNDWVIPNASFQAAWPLTTGLVEMLDRKQGEDWWVGELAFEVSAGGFL